jgi:hypothetical protein
MNIQDEIANAQQAQCRHVWGETTFSPYYKREERAVSGQYEYYGIHMHQRTIYVDVKKDRWMRACQTCGFVEYTETMRDITHSEPKFK